MTGWHCRARCGVHPEGSSGRDDQVPGRDTNVAPAGSGSGRSSVLIRPALQSVMEHDHECAASSLFLQAPLALRDTQHSLINHSCPNT